MYKDVKSEKEAVFTCGVGVSACVGAFVLEYVGHTGQITVYDGSWQEYQKYKIPDYTNLEWEKDYKVETKEKPAG